MSGASDSYNRGTRIITRHTRDPEVGGRGYSWLPLSRAYQMLVDVYVDYLHHNDGSNLDSGIDKVAICQCLWCELLAQFFRWYTGMLGKVGHRLTKFMSE